MSIAPPEVHLPEHAQDLLTLHDANSEVVRLRAELFEAKHEIDRLKDRVHHANEIDQVRQELQELRNQVEQIQQDRELKALREELRILKEERNNLRDRNGASEHALSMARKENVALVEEHARLVLDVEKKHLVFEAEKTYQQETLEVVSLKMASTKKVLEETVETVEEAVRAAQDAREEFEKQLSERDTQNRVLQEQISELQKMQNSTALVVRTTQCELKDVK